jgi:hypothetical protein
VTVKGEPVVGKLLRGHSASRAVVRPDSMQVEGADACEVEAANRAEVHGFAFASTSRCPHAG